MSRTFTCARCELVFDSEWSEEEALAEKEQLFGNVPKEDCDVVCDDCFKLLTSGGSGFKDEDPIKHYNECHNPALQSAACDLADCPWHIFDERRTKTRI